MRRPQCARYGELAEVSELLAAGVAADAADAEGRTALFLAAANGHAAVVQLLLANGAVRGAAADVLRAARRRVAIARRSALTGGAQPWRWLAQDARRAKADGSTPLHWACLNGQAEVAQLLLAAGASVTALNAAARTPYDEALQSASQATLDALAAAAPPGDEQDDVEEGDEPAEGEQLMPVD